MFNENESKKIYTYKNKRKASPNVSNVNIPLQYQYDHIAKFCMDNNLEGYKHTRVSSNDTGLKDLLSSFSTNEVDTLIYFYDQSLNIVGGNLEIINWINSTKIN